jgi:hypothetical protein
MALGSAQRKIKLKSVSHLRRGEKCPSAHHVCHAFHHKVTTKTPRLRKHFFKKPLQNSHSTTAKKTRQFASSAKEIARTEKLSGRSLQH